MPFELSIPLITGDPLHFTLDAGQSVFVLGANGTGKSSLIQKFYNAQTEKARRISAHRQTWFSSNALTISALDRKNTETQIHNSDRQPQSRWRDDYSAQRPSIAIYDLIDAENIRARGIAGAVDNSNMDLAQTLSKKDAPIKAINELLKLSNLPIEISVHEADQVMASKYGGPQYSVAQLSDGERNVLLIASEVLTVKADTILFIDEPERHLHRSIISPLLGLLFGSRPDCAFVISTHEVMLPLDHPSARTVLLRGCANDGVNVTGWSADLVNAGAEIDEDLKKDLLGGRRRLLFVEGEEGSLDKSLYSLLFPEVSVIAKSGCRDVEHAVSGVRASGDLHWLRAFGIVDNDRRAQADVDRLKAVGVYALSSFSVESIYYHVELQRRLAERQSDLTGTDANALLEGAENEALAAIAPQIDRLSERAVEVSLRQELMGKLPRRADIAAGQNISLTIDVAATVAAEAARLKEACERKDLRSILARYPVRETPALDAIAKRLGFQNRSQYEAAVRKLLIDDPSALAFVVSLFGTLPTEIASI